MQKKFGFEIKNCAGDGTGFMKLLTERRLLTYYLLLRKKSDKPYYPAINVYTFLAGHKCCVCAYERIQ